MPTTRPPIALLDRELRQAGLQGVPAWYIRALQDPSVTTIDGVPKEQFLPFSPQSKEYPIQQRWASSAAAPPPPRTQPPVAAPQAAPRRAPQARVTPGPMFGDDLPSNADAWSMVSLDDPDTGSHADAGLYANLPFDIDTGRREDAGLYAHLPPRVYPAESDMPTNTLADLERLYRIRMSLPPAQRAQVERDYEAHLAAAQPGLSSPTSLDPVEAAAIDLPDDPEVGPRTTSASGGPVPESPARAPDDIDTGTRAAAGLAANLPPLPPTEEDFVDRERMVAERVRQSDAVSPGLRRAAAEAYTQFPTDPSSQDPFDPRYRAAVRQAIAEENAQVAAAQQAQRAQEYEEDFGQMDRNIANRRRMDAYGLGGVNPMQDTTALTPQQAQRHRDWAVSGSAERMAQYAPDEWERRWQAGVDERHNEYMREQYDPEYKKSKIAAERRTLDAQQPAANNALRRELQRLGIDTDQFESNADNRLEQNQKFDRDKAYAAKQKALNARWVGRQDAVIRRAQMQQNPVEFLGRSDINDDQRLAVQFFLANGRGPTPNEVKALQAKGLLEGVQMGLRQQVNVNNADAAVRVAMEENERKRGEAAVAAADDWYNSNIGILPGRRSWGQAAYNDLVAFLQSPAYGLTAQQAAQVASKFGPPQGP